ncbi:MAG: GDSL-type esterase/lipase family protein [Planctomycetota bacterium]
MTRSRWFRTATTALCTACLYVGAADAQPERVLFLGDSITQGDANHRSFRYEAFKGLVDGGWTPGVDFDFVGSWQDHFGGDPTFPDYQGHAFDRDHEGHWGWRTWQVLEGEGVGDPPAGSGTGMLDEWLDGYTPDTAFVLLGTNDISRNNPSGRSWRPRDVAPRIEQIVEVLQADNPDMRILLGTLIPRQGSWFDTELAEFNAYLPGIAANKTTATSTVEVLDLYAHLDWTEHTYDGTHPNEAGEAIIGRLVAAALLPPAPGDANRDGAVDLLDFDILAGHFGKASGATFGQGDFNGDGAVDLLDFDLLASNFDSVSLAQLAALAVPEPASGMLLWAGAWAALRRRRR